MMDDENPVLTEEQLAKDFAPRPYQIYLFEEAVRENRIIYLPTGTGKTYIAVLLIKHLSGEVTKEYEKDGKRTIFIVNTVALVNQQSAFLNRHTGLVCKGYSGDMGVDDWSKEFWIEEFKNNQVLTMTAQIFVNIICQGIMPLYKVNLIIFDECHRGVSNHPMRQIMQRFADYKPHQLPRVLAMSATLLNANVSSNKINETVKELETTYHAKVSTIDSLETVAKYATKPQELVVYYDSSSEFITEDIQFIVNSTEQTLQHINIPNKYVNPSSSKVFAPPSKTSKLLNMLRDVVDHIQEMGLYGGTKCVLFHIIQLERIKKCCDDQVLMYVLDYLITQLIKIQKLINDRIIGEGKDLIYRNSSQKVLKLITVLKNFHAEIKEDQKFCCIIFVQKRFTAKILYKLLKDLNEWEPEFKFLMPDFMVGYNNDPYKNPVELECLARRNKQALAGFRNGTVNCIVATDVVDEGVDIPACTLIIRYYAPMDFRAYVQSKGRARFATSKFIILAETEKDYSNRYQLFKTTEKYLHMSLHGKTDLRTQPTPTEIADHLYQTTIEPYKIRKEDGSFSIITEQLAVSLINQYCTSLIKSKFITLSPTWIKVEVPTLAGLYFKVHLTLPSVCPVTETIISDSMADLDAAKRSAAMKACIRLHEVGEIKDNLQFRKPEDSLYDLEYLFPHMKKEEKNKSCMPGTNSKKRRYDIEYPKALIDAYPRPNQPLYLHVLEMKPQYAVPADNRNKVFFNLLNSSKTFGILSSKCMPKIPSFPVFMNVGDLQVTLGANKKTLLPMTEEQLESLKCFHFAIFQRIINSMKEFLHFDPNKRENSYLIVPLDDKEDIDWEAVSSVETKIKGYRIGKIKEESPKVPEDIVRNAEYDLALVYPSYRSPDVYIVTEVCIDKKAESPFPQDNYLTYVHYYKDKHNLPIQNPQQSLLEVKVVSKKINCIKPRNIKPNSTKRRRAHLTEDFEEHMVPELCGKIKFPSVYWLKAGVLPSILHRISQLLVAEDLRLEIEPQMDTILTRPPPDYEWKPLRINEIAQKENNENLSLESISDESATEDDSEDEKMEVDFSDNLGNMALEIAVINQETGLVGRDLLDMERFPEEANLMAIEEERKIFSSFDGLNYYQSLQATRNTCRRKALNVPVPELKMLIATNKYGPSPVDIMKALTAKMSNDSFDLERVETLGDSFLKFAISTYLFQEFPTFGEGILTYIKGKLVGNLNLYYCGQQKKLASRMKVEEFLPATFPVPAFSVPDKIKKRVIKDEIATSVLYEMSMPEHERITGCVSNETLKAMNSKIEKWLKNIDSSGMERYFGIQVVSDKTASDCVEALIGTYLLSLGMKGACRLLSWFEILPKDLDIEQSFNFKIPNPILQAGNVDELLPLASKIEENLGYKFQNRAFLLQALTHPSHMANRITSSYQRLEFLGDAILDFLLTVHIYETCGNLSPGDLTDLRSALVNNITFACLAVRYELHAALLMHAPKMFQLIDKFVSFQEARKFEVNDELLLVLLEEEDCNMAEHVDVPKILGDIFESVIGAIFLDSGKSLSTVWQVIYRLMKEEIDEFSKNVPKQPIRVIFETQGARPKFSKTILVEGAQMMMTTLSIICNGTRKYFHGFGSTKKLAKCAASKQALKYLRYKK